MLLWAVCCGICPLTRAVPAAVLLGSIPVASGQLLPWRGLGGLPVFRFELVAAGIGVGVGVGVGVV